MIKNKINIDNFQIFLLCLLPITFVIGPFVVELFSNIIILIFIYKIFKNKNFNIFKNKLFIFFLLFYCLILLSLFQSNYFNETKINVFFYFRFFLLSFAIYEILKINKNYLRYLFIVLLITAFVVSFDGYFQFFFEKNLIGFEKYRIDRISGFFKDDLILGSYISRILPLIIGLTIYFKKEIKLYRASLLVIILCILLIFLSGERAAFLKTLIGLTIIFFILNIKWKIKILSITFIVLSIIFSVSVNPIIFDRYVTQLKIHLVKKDAQHDQLIFLENYSPMFETAFKMYNDSKILGKGPKSYRYHCKEPQFITFFPNKYKKVDNTILKIELSWKQKGDIKINEIFFSEGDVIEKGEKLFSYNFRGKDNQLIYISNREGIINKIYKKNYYQRNNIFLKLDPQNSPNEEQFKISACNTHPHNFYFQLLAETGFLGFIMVFLLFLFISFLLIKNFIFYLTNSSKKMPDSDLVILIGFFLVLWPLTTNGNFFNNWINLINFYPLGIYLFLRRQRKNE